MDERGIAARAWVRWTFGFALPLACFAIALGLLGFLPSDLDDFPRAAPLAWAATSLTAMAISTRRRARGAPPSMLLAGLLASGALFAFAHTIGLLIVALGVVFLFWPLALFALAPPAAAVVYASCAVDEAVRALHAGRARWTPFALGLTASLVAAALATQTVRGTETLLLARLVEPEAELDEAQLAPLRAIGWLDRWQRIRSVRSAWVREQPPAYRGRTLRARQVLHALTGEYDGPPPGAE